MRWDLAAEQEMFRDSFAGWLADHAGTDTVRRWQDAGDAAPHARARRAGSRAGQHASPPAPLRSRRRDRGGGPGARAPRRR